MRSQPRAWITRDTVDNFWQADGKADQIRREKAQTRVLNAHARTDRRRQASQDMERQLEWPATLGAGAP